MGRGLAYSKKRNLDRAITDYTEVIRLNPKDKGAFYFRGGAYSKKGDYDRAIADYSEAIRLDQKDVLAFYAHGTAYLNKQDYGGAFSDFITVAESKHAPAEMAASAATGIGFMYENGQGIARDDSQAIHWFRIAADKGDDIAMVQIGLLHPKARDCYSARHWFEKAAVAGNKNATQALRSSSFGPCQWQNQQRAAIQEARW
jgi:TPR repeat protein